MHRSYFTYTLVGLLSLVLSACTQQSTTSKETPESETAASAVLKLSQQQLANTSISYDSIRKMPVAATIRANGKIDVPPQNLVSISTPMGGYLTHTKLLPGLHIKKGEVIATLEDQSYIQLQEEYLTTKEKLAFLQLEYDRQKELNTSKASSDKNLQQVEMEYRSTKIKLKALGEKLKLIHIRPDALNEHNISKSIQMYAPIDGFVSSVNVNIGKYITPSDVLFELVNPEDIHLNLHIFEKDLSKLYIGQKLLAFSNNKPNEKHPCSIILISQNINAERYAEVHCHFEDYDRALLPGMYMNAEIQLADSNSAAIPSDAIVRYAGKEYLFIARNEQEFEMQEVKTGTSSKGYTQVLNSEIFSGKKIVNKGAYTLLMSLKNVGEEE